MSSLSSSADASHLLCHESPGEVVSASTFGSVSGLYAPSDDDKSFILHLFDAELEQLPSRQVFRRVANCEDVAQARLEAVDWMLKVSGHHNFRHETVYLSVNYLDRFLCSHDLPEGKKWPWQLLSVACLSLAAKMEEIRVPRLLDLQVLGPKFVFQPKTVECMELLVMAALGWRLRLITPFDFVHYFVAELQCRSTQVGSFSGLVTGACDLILVSCRAVDFMDHTPSAIAAAAVLYAACQRGNDCGTVLFHERVSKEPVQRCCFLFEKHSAINLFRPRCNKKKIVKFIPSPVGVMDEADKKRLQPSGSLCQKFVIDAE
ncbi:hypothetical protein NMG60_11025946 [Bertholletia excelsa]